ncbi:MAG TPA: alpha/beta family hydrolase [Planktothrix sp.]|jgi:hypothetical protein
MANPKNQSSDAEDVTFGDGLHGTIGGRAEQGAVLISHGAGGSKDTPFLKSIASSLEEIGFLTLRWNFGYVDSGRVASAGGKKELPEMQCAIEFLKARAPAVPLILLGKSFGGRVSTYVGQDRDDIAAYVFLGLPLQSMNANGKPRDWSHMAKLAGKLLFITGDKDKLCPLEQLKDVQKSVLVPYKSVVVPGGHSYSQKGTKQALSELILWMDETFACGALR